MPLSQSDKKDFIDGWIVVVFAEHAEKMESQELEAMHSWSREEIERFSEIGNQTIKTSWCVGRYLQRSILSVLMEVEPDNLTFEYGKYGKPFLHGSDVNFNLSHTTGCTMLAVSAQGGIGCDIEIAYQPVPNFNLVSNSFFSDSEKSWIESAANEKKRVERFLVLYVEKEAIIKASGSSLWNNLTEIRGSMIEPPFMGRYTSIFKHGRKDRYIAAVNSLRPISGKVKIQNQNIFQRGSVMMEGI